jgi:hypothetical protein
MGAAKPHAVTPSASLGMASANLSSSLPFSASPNMLSFSLLVPFAAQPSVVCVSFWEREAAQQADAWAADHAAWLDLGEPR